jgi:hypothetical protein
LENPIFALLNSSSLTFHRKNPSEFFTILEKMNIKALLMVVMPVCFSGNMAVAQPLDSLPNAVSARNEYGMSLVTVGPNLGGSLLAPLRYGDKLFYTATVPTKTGKVSRIFSMAFDNDMAYPLPINPKEDQLHIAHVALNAAADRMYYTLIREPNPSKPNQSELWYRDKTYEGNWSPAVKLPAHINKPGSSSQQPSVGFDFSQKKEILFYASNRPGGKGGFDIWYCTVERDGSFGEPVNFVMNSTADEVTPHFFSQKQMLFFSSNFFLGKGGFDIYQTVRNEDGLWSEMENLEQANSRFDELYFTYHLQSQTSYFCSNRPNANCDNEPLGCSDFSIFSAKMGGHLVVNILNEADNSAISGCNIELEDTSTGMVETTVTKSKTNTLQLPIYPDKKYRLIVSKMGYYPVFIELQSAASNCFQTLTQRVMLRPMK